MTLLTLDFETYYDKQFSLSKLTTEAYVRDPLFEVIGVSVKVNDGEPQWFSGTKDETAEFLDQFDWKNSFMLAHNCAFDALILSHHFGHVPKFYFDTMSMARPLHAQLRSTSLKALAEHYGIGAKGDEVHNAIGKRRADFTPVDLVRYGDYCKTDVQLTYILWKTMMKDLPRDEIKVIDLFIRMYADSVLELDIPLLTNHLGAVRERKETLLTGIQEIAGQDVLMSNPKFADLLTRLGVTPPKKVSPTTGKETYAFGKTDLDFKNLLEHPDLRVQAVVGARLGVKSTIEESRTESFLAIAERGKLPIPLRYYAAHTGRAGGWDKINLQNLPSRGGDNSLRRAIRAPKDHVLVACDSSQIEARVVAWLAGEDELVEDFRNGVDIYSKFASSVYEYPVTKAQKVERFVGKTCILGLGYGMGPAKFQHTLKTGNPSVDMPTPDCNRVVKLYRDTYRNIVRLWWNADLALNAIIRKQDYAFGKAQLLTITEDGITLPTGMIVRYPYLTKTQEGLVYARDPYQKAQWAAQELTGNHTAAGGTKIYGGKVVENVVQALARIVVFEQMLRVAEHYRVVLTVHDEVVVCVPQSEATDTRDHLIDIMSTPPAWAPDLPVACEAGVGETYGDVK